MCVHINTQRPYRTQEKIVERSRKKTGNIQDAFRHLCPSKNPCSKRSPVRKRPRVLAGIRSRKLSRNAELSSLLDLHGVFASQVLTVLSGIWEVLVAKRRTVVAFGLAWHLRVSKVSTVSGIGEVLVAKRGTVVTFGLAWRLRVSKVSTVTGIVEVLVAKRRTVVAFGLAWRGGAFRLPGG